MCSLDRFLNRVARRQCGQERKQRRRRLRSCSRNRRPGRGIMDALLSCARQVRSGTLPVDADDVNVSQGA